MHQYWKNVCKWIALGFLLCIFCILLIQTVSGESITLYPIFDNQISNAYPNQTGYNISTLNGNTLGTATSTTCIIGWMTTARTGTNLFNRSDRCYFSFDLSYIPDTSIITDANLEYVITGTKYNMLGLPAFAVSNFTPSSYYVYTANDYNSTSLELMSDYVEYWQSNTGYRNINTLNQTGLNYLNNQLSSNLAGLVLLTNWDINKTYLNNTAQWATQRSSNITIYMSDQLDIMNDVKLNIIYSGNTSSAGSTTINLENENQEEFFGEVNYYFLMILILGILAIAIWLESMIAFVSVALSVGGIVVSLDKGFTFALAYVVLLVISLYVAFSGE